MDRDINKKLKIIEHYVTMVIKKRIFFFKNVTFANFQMSRRVFFIHKSRFFVFDRNEPYLNLVDEGEGESRTSLDMSRLSLGHGRHGRNFRQSHKAICITSLLLEGAKFDTFFMTHAVIGVVRGVSDSPIR